MGSRDEFNGKGIRMRLLFLCGVRYRGEYRIYPFCFDYDYRIKI